MRISGGAIGEVAIIEGGNTVTIVQLNSDDVLATEYGLSAFGAMYGYDGATWDRLRTIRSDADGRTPVSSGALATVAHASLFNGGSYDRMRGNLDSETLLASAQRASTTAIATPTNHNGRALMLLLDVTAAPGGDTIRLDVELYNAVSSAFNPFTSFAALSTTGARRYVIGLGVGTSGGGLAEVAEIPLPRQWRVNIVHSAGSNFTYSLNGAVIL